MTELFRCTKLKCGVLWAFMVTPTPGSWCELQPRFCRLPHLMWRAFERGVVGSSVAARLQLSLVLRAFCAVGAVLRRGLDESMRNKYKLKNLWNPSWKVLRMFNSCILLFYNCFVFFKNSASTLIFIDTKQMYFLVQIKILWHCILQL